MRLVFLVSTPLVVLCVGSACPPIIEGESSGGLGSSATEASSTGSTGSTGTTGTTGGTSDTVASMGGGMTEGSGTASETSSSGSGVSSSSTSSSGSSSGSTTGGSSGSTTGGACVDSDCEQGVCVDGVCGPAASCLELHDAHDDLEDGIYTIDVDGAGGADPFEVDCDMEEGWSCVYFNDFELDSEGWSKGSTTNCDDDNILGGYDQLGKDKPVERTFDLKGIVHSELRVSGDLYIIDSWDDEKMSIELDGKEIWGKNFDKANFDSKYCGFTWKDWIEPFSAEADHGAGEAVLRFLADLSAGPLDESFGLDDIRVCIK